MGGWGGGGVGGSGGMYTKNGIYCENEKKKSGGGGSGWMCTLNGSYCENEKKSRGGGGGVRSGVGVCVCVGSKVWGRWVMWGMGDVNQDKKALINVNKGLYNIKNN